MRDTRVVQTHPRLGMHAYVSGPARKGLQRQTCPTPEHPSTTILVSGYNKITTRSVPAQVSNEDQHRICAAGREITAPLQPGTTLEHLPTTSAAVSELRTRTARHLSQVPAATPSFRFTPTAFGGPRGSEEIITCDSGVQAAVDAACCDPPFTAVINCPGTSAIQSASCPDLRSMVVCCAA